MGKQLMMFRTDSIFDRNFEDRHGTVGGSTNVGHFQFSFSHRIDEIGLPKNFKKIRTWREFKCHILLQYSTREMLFSLARNKKGNKWTTFLGDYDFRWCFNEYISTNRLSKARETILPGAQKGVLEVSKMLKALGRWFSFWRVSAKNSFPA